MATNPFQDPARDEPAEPALLSQAPRVGQCFVPLSFTTFKVIAAPCKKHEDCLGDEELGASCSATSIQPLGPFNDGDDLTDLGQARRYARRLLKEGCVVPPLFIVENSTGCHVEMVVW